MEPKRLITDFTEGSIPKHLIAFATPMLLGNLLQALYNTVDSIWVGRFLGPDALAAVSVGFPIIFALIALVMGITMATTVLVSQYFGARRNDDVVRTVNNSMLLLTVLGAAVSLAGVLFRRPLLILINCPPEIIDAASGYLGIFMVGMVPMFIYNAVGAILRGVGDSKTPLRFLAYTTGINVVLDPILIFGLGPIPALGVRGAALATVISIIVSAVISIRYLYGTSGLVTYRPGTFHLDWELTKTTFRIGLPAGAQQVLVSLSSVVVGSIVNSFGKVVVAGFGAAMRLDQFGFMPAMSVGMAVSSLVGQNLGADKTRRVNETVKWAVLLSGGITLLFSILVGFWPKVLLTPFTDDPAVTAAGAGYFHYMAFAYIAMAMMFAMAGVLRGAGDTVPAMLFTLISLWVVRVPLARYFSSLPGLGVNGVFLAIALSPYAGMIAYYFYYRNGRWKEKAVTRRRPGPMGGRLVPAAEGPEDAADTPVSGRGGAGQPEAASARAGS